MTELAHVSNIERASACKSKGPAPLQTFYTATGPIEFYPVRYAAAPIPIALMVLQGVAKRILDPDYESTITLVDRLDRSVLESAYKNYSASMLTTLMLSSPAKSMFFLYETARYIMFRQDATGLESIYSSLLQSNWKFCVHKTASNGLRVWDHFVRRGRFAAEHPTYLFDTTDRTMTGIDAGGLKNLQVDANALNSAGAALRGLGGRGGAGGPTGSDGLGDFGGPTGYGGRGGAGGPTGYGGRGDFGGPTGSGGRGDPSGFGSQVGMGSRDVGFGDIGLSGNIGDLAGLGGVFARPEQVMDKSDARTAAGAIAIGVGSVIAGAGLGAIIGGSAGAAGPVALGIGTCILIVGSAVYYDNELAKGSSAGSAGGTGGGDAGTAGGATGSGPSSAGGTPDRKDLPDATKGSSGTPTPANKPNPMNYYPSAMDYYPSPTGAAGGNSRWAGIRDIDAVGAFGPGLAALVIRVGKSTVQVR